MVSNVLAFATGCVEADPTTRLLKEITDDDLSAAARPALLSMEVVEAKAGEYAVLRVLIRNGNQESLLVRERPRRFEARFPYDLASVDPPYLWRIPGGSGGRLSCESFVRLEYGEVFGYELKIPVPSGQRGKDMDFSLFYDGFTLRGTIRNGVLQPSRLEGERN